MLNEIKSLDELREMFPTDAVAVEHFRKLRWPHGPICHACGSVKVYVLAASEWMKCGDCRTKFSVRHDTIFFDSKLSLRKWYAAIFLVTSHKKGIASAQLARDIKVTQKTAWHMLHRIREAAKTQSFRRTLRGTIEADETFLGGKPRNMHADKRRAAYRNPRWGKRIVFGMLEHGGELRLHHVKKIADIRPIIAANVAPHSSVHTDEAPHFKWMRSNYNWSLVKHSLHEYVKEDGTTTNRIEGAFGHFKRSVVGVYHQMSDHHLDSYLTLFAWRWNRRKMEEGERVNALLAATVGHKLPYKLLIARNERKAA